jgi:hypothetical protein
MHAERRHARPRLRALELVEERALGGKLAGSLYLTGAITATAILAVRGVETRHWRIMLLLAGIGVAWALCCFFVIPWERANPLVSHFSCALGFPITAVAVASTGGAASPAVFYLLFIVGYCAYFYRRREAVPFLLACIFVHSAARAKDVVSRLGGDESAIVSRGVDADAIDGLAKRVVASVRAASAGLGAIPGFELRCSAGAALYPADAHSVDELVATADLCMRGAKATGKDRPLSTRDFALDSAAVA